MINIGIEYLSPSDQVGKGGSRELDAAAIFTPLKCGCTSRWDSVTFEAL